jgi:hypothetical protein
MFFIGIILLNVKNEMTTWKVFHISTVRGFCGRVVCQIVFKDFFIMLILLSRVSGFRHFFFFIFNNAR